MNVSQTYSGFAQPVTAAAYSSSPPYFSGIPVDSKVYKPFYGEISSYRFFIPSQNNVATVTGRNLSINEQRFNLVHQAHIVGVATLTPRGNLEKQKETEKKDRRFEVEHQAAFLKAYLEAIIANLDSERLKLSIPEFLQKLHDSIPLCQEEIVRTI